MCYSVSSKSLHSLTIGNILEAGYLEITRNDYYLIFCILKLNVTNIGGHEMTKTRNMKQYNEEEFLADIAKITLESVVNTTDDVDSIVEIRSFLFSSIVDKHAPVRDIRVSGKNYPWVNDELKIFDEI